MTRRTAEARPRNPWTPADLLGLSRLGVDATLGVVDIVEAMHHTIASRSGIVGASPAGRPSGITGFVYSAVRGSTRTVGLGLTALLGALGGGTGGGTPTVASSPRREALLAALNGVFGDHLAETANPLAIPSTLRVRGRSLDLHRPLADQGLGTAVHAEPARILVLIHGLCMNDLQWTRRGHDHGAALARDEGWTPVYFHYNSGRHVSQNGRDLAELLEALSAAWPGPLQEIAMLCHSMGGLVARSACLHAAQSQHAWLHRLRRMVFLGTPHHGAPMERGGRWIDTVFGLSPYVRPFARLGKARSAGITDLRWGNVHDADGHGRDRHAQGRDDRRPAPLPAGVDAFAVAATAAHSATSMRSKLIGDGLVPVASALGDHRRPSMALGIPAARRKVIGAANHWDLLDRADVYSTLRVWLSR